MAREPSIVSNSKPLEEKRISPEFVEEIINKTEGNFIPGDTNRKAFKSLMKADALQDPFIQDYPANIVPETNFIAAVGPRTPDRVSTFFHQFVFSGQLPPVKKFIALGVGLGDRNQARTWDSRDFLDYFTAYNDTEKEVIYIPLTTKNENSSYSIKAQYPTIIHSVFYMPEKNGRYSYERRPVQSCIELTYLCPDEDQKIVKVVVTHLPVFDSKSLLLESNRYVFGKTIKHYGSEEGLERDNLILWRLYQYSLENPVVIHCKAGHGRTGNLILIFELLRNFKNIFIGTTADQASTEILKVLERIRETRPGLVSMDEQFSDAIKKAVELYNWALKKRFPLNAQKYKQVLPDPRPRMPLIWSTKTQSLKQYPAPTADTTRAGFISEQKQPENSSPYVIETDASSTATRKNYQCSTIMSILASDLAYPPVYVYGVGLPINLNREGFIDRLQSLKQANQDLYKQQILDACKNNDIYLSAALKLNRLVTSNDEKVISIEVLTDEIDIYEARQDKGFFRKFQGSTQTIKDLKVLVQLAQDTGSLIYKSDLDFIVKLRTERTVATRVGFFSKESESKSINQKRSHTQELIDALYGQFNQSNLYPEIQIP